MKKIFKGCLISFAAILCLLIVGSICYYIYLNTPNKVVFSNKPLNQSTYLDATFKINNLVAKQSDKNILYQSLLREDSGFDLTSHYIVVYKAIRSIELDKKLPISRADISKLEQGLLYRRFRSNAANNEINLFSQIPADRQTPTGYRLTVYSPVKKLAIQLSQGSYSTLTESIDKDGFFSDLIIYDKKNALLYYDRKRYFAFQ